MGLTKLTGAWMQGKYGLVVRKARLVRMHVRNRAVEQKRPKHKGSLLSEDPIGISGGLNLALGEQWNGKPG